MAFDHNVTQRIVAKVKRRIVKDPASRWRDWSSRLARWGALCTASLGMIKDKLHPDMIYWTSFALFVAIGAAKLIAEERNHSEEKTDEGK